MNNEAIEARLAQLRASLAEVQGTYAAIQGAIQDCEFWLARLDQENAPSLSPDEPPALRPVPSQEDAG